MEDLPYTLERTVRVVAPVSTVFRYFTDSARFAAWWGEGSTIEGRVGGTVHIRHPNAVVAGGRVVEIEPDRRIVFTYGFESGSPIPIGASRVTVTLVETAGGTQVRLRHELPDAKTRDEHVQGWRYQLALFANVVSREAHTAAADRVDAFFALWAEGDTTVRRRALTAVAAEGLVFRDPYSCTAGIDDLNTHIEASRRFMPGVVLRRAGEVRLCQGVALVDWTVGDRRGTNMFELAPDGRITRVTGFWG